MTDNTTNQAAGGANAIDAATFFKLSGRPESYKAGSCLFPEAQRLSAIAPADVRIYLLVSGAVTLTRYGKPISLIMPGEMFGVNSVIHPTSHFATATAMKDCTAISLDPKQFLHELQKNPTFILTLLSDLARRLQGVMPRVIKTGRSTVEPPVSTALNADQIRLLAQKLGDPMPARSDAGGTVISEGARAIYMYVLKEGRVHIKVESRVIEVVLAGTVFGEMALAGVTRRSAMAIAESASAWYSIDSKQLVAVTKADRETDGTRAQRGHGGTTTSGGRRRSAAPRQVSWQLSGRPVQAIEPTNKMLPVAISRDQVIHSSRDRIDPTTAYDHSRIGDLIGMYDQIAHRPTARAARLLGEL